MIVAGALVLAAVIGGFLFNRAHAADSYRGHVSDHFDGQRFHNIGLAPRIERKRSNNRTVLKWMLERSRSGWTWRDDVQQIRPDERVQGTLIVVTYVNHATILIQTAGLNILTDPVWAYRVSPFYILGPRRYREPGVRLEDLPPIDIVLLSHNHYDHMDIATLRHIARKWHPRILCALGNAAYLRKRGIPGAEEFDWWGEVTVNDHVKVVCTPAQHFSARVISDRNKTLWCGFIIEAHGDAIYFAGDTGYGQFIEDIQKHYSKFRLAFLPIGAYKPSWMMRPVHLSPDEALHVHRHLAVETSVGIHFGTFRMADDAQEEAPERVRTLVAEQKEGSTDFRTLRNGETIKIE